MEHIWQRLEFGEAQCFWQDSKGGLWFKDHLVVPKNVELHRKIMDEAHCYRYSIHPGTNKMYQDIKKNFLCIRMKREIQGMCQRVTRVKGSRPIIWGQLEICNLWAFPSGSGKTFAWTSSWVCLTPHVGTTRNGSLWTAWPGRLTLYPYPPPTGSDNMTSSTYHKLSTIMVSHRPSSLTDCLSLWHDFGNNYMTVWAPISSIV
jgi:hypothetical protein